MTRKPPKIPDDVQQCGGWNSGTRLHRFLFKMAEAARYTENKGQVGHPEWMAPYRFAWQGRGGLLFTGAQLPAGWKNPYWEIREKFGDMVMVWGEDEQAASAEPVQV